MKLPWATKACWKNSNIDADELKSKAESLRNQGETVVFAAVDGRAAGMLGIADPVKPEAAQAIRDLRSQGLRVVMLTGDSETTAKAMARQLGIDDFEAGVLPDHKAEVVKKLQQQGRIVAMAGDGVNDAPALAQAQVGIAMGTGTDVAMESAGITLLKGDLAALVRARRLSRAVMRNIRENLFFAFIYNSVGVPDCGGHSLSQVWHSAEPDHRRRGHELQFGVGDQQCSALAKRQAVTRERGSRCRQRDCSRPSNFCASLVTVKENATHSCLLRLHSSPTVTRCQTCGKEIPAGADSCPACGRNQSAARPG